MTTEELENKLKISKNTCIHCPTLELAKQVLSIFDQLGLKWCSGKSYIIHTGWDNHEENTIYYPFDGEFSSLKFANLTGYKIINAKEFIALHTEKKEEFDLENYEPKGDLEGFPKEIISRMLECQVEQGNKRDVTVFERNVYSSVDQGGFDWDKTIEKGIFWSEVISANNLKLFFKKYQKKDNQQVNSQEFKLGDKVYDIVLGKAGVVSNINMNHASIYQVGVDFGDYGTKCYSFEGKSNIINKYPQILYYRDDYDYSVIDFNNLPKKQEHKRWRAEKNRIYYYVNFYTKDWFLPDETYDYYTPMDHDNYYSGNYLQTKEEAQEVADKLNKYFQELLNTIEMMKS